MNNNLFEYCLLDSSVAENPHVVVWSGGCDSTAILYAVAKKFSTKEKPVIAVSYDFSHIQGMKRHKEDEAKEKFLTYCKQEGLNIDHKVINLNVDMDVYQYGSLIQAYTWVSTLGPYLKDKTNLYLGYIRTDDIWHQFGELKELLKSTQKYLKRELNVLTPLQYREKDEIIKYLVETGIYKMTWYCELPTLNGEKCEYCAPCKTHEMAIMKMAYYGDEWAIKQLPPHLKYIKKHAPSKEIQIQR